MWFLLLTWLVLAFAFGTISRAREIGVGGRMVAGALSLVFWAGVLALGLIGMVGFAFTVGG